MKEILRFSDYDNLIIMTTPLTLRVSEYILRKECVSFNVPILRTSESENLCYCNSNFKCTLKVHAK